MVPTPGETGRWDAGAIPANARRVRAPSWRLRPGVWTAVHHRRRSVRPSRGTVPSRERRRRRVPARPVEPASFLLLFFFFFKAVPAPLPAFLCCIVFVKNKITVLSCPELCSSVLFPLPRHTTDTAGTRRGTRDEKGRERAPESTPRRPRCRFNSTEPLRENPTSGMQYNATRFRSSKSDEAWCFFVTLKHNM